MTKEERLAYMRTRFPKMEATRVDAVLPVTKHDVLDELGLSDPYREHVRDKELPLTSDETR